MTTGTVQDVRKSLDDEIIRLRTHIARLEALRDELPEDMSLDASHGLMTLIARAKAR